MWAVKQKDAFSLGNYICPEIARCLLFYNQQSHFLNKWRLSIILLPTHFSVPRGQTLLFLAQLARLKQSSCCSSWLQEEFGVWSPFACPHLLIWVMACSISRKKKKNQWICAFASNAQGQALYLKPCVHEKTAAALLVRAALWAGKWEHISLRSSGAPSSVVALQRCIARHRVMQGSSSDEVLVPWWILEKCL